MLSHESRRLAVWLIFNVRQNMSASDHPAVSAYSNRGQGVFLVLYALDSLGGGNSKQDVIGCISRGGWYDVTRHDLPPYDGKNEPKYHTLLAWARKDCYEREWMLLTDQRDDWSISRNGRLVLERAIERYRKKEWDVRKCYLWKKSFKKVIDPTYEPSSLDAVRPPEKPDITGLLADLIASLADKKNA
ncbi:MAG: hypothetical protein RL077_3465 [Verrucomicrobiota bacterium]